MHAHKIFASNHYAVYNGQTHAAEHLFGFSFIHRKGGAQNTRMRVGKLHPLQHPLNTTVFAPTSMQRIEHHIGLSKLQVLHETMTSINLDNAIARLPQGGGALLACRKRHSTLRAWSTHQYSHSLGSPARHTHCSRSIFDPLWGSCYRVFYAFTYIWGLRPSLLPTLTSNRSHRKPFFALILPKFQDLSR